MEQLLALHLPAKKTETANGPKISKFSSGRKGDGPWALTLWNVNKCLQGER